VSAPEVTICAECHEPIWSGYWTRLWFHYEEADHKAKPAGGNSADNLARAEARAAETGLDLLATRQP
jgi:hypothetical protein